MRSEHHDERCIPLSPVIPKSLVTCSKDRSARFRRRTDACTPSDAKAQIAASQGFAYSLHHEVRQSSSLIRHRANIRMRLRFELNVLLRALCINADLTDRQISRRSMYNKPRNVQKLLCCLLDQRSLGPRIPESESARSIGHEKATGIPLYISRYVQRRTHLDVKKNELSCEDTFKAIRLLTWSYFVTAQDSSHPIQLAPSPSHIGTKCDADTLVVPRLVRISLSFPCQSEPTRLLGPHPVDSCGSVQRSCGTTQYSTPHIKRFEAQTSPE